MKKSGKCPICGSSGDIEIRNSQMSHMLCPKCRCRDFVGTIKERSFDLALVDWFCRACGHKWFGCCVLPQELVAGSVVWSEVHE